MEGVSSARAREKIYRTERFWVVVFLSYEPQESEGKENEAGERVILFLTI